MDTLNDDLVITPMIETSLSLERLDSITSIVGVEVLLIGSFDRSIQLGVPRDYSCVTYQCALDAIAATGAKHRILAGIKR